MFKLDLEKAEKPEIKLSASAGSLKRQENIYFCFIDYAKAFDYVDHNKLWKILKEMGIPGHLPASWKICMQVKKQQLELDMKLQIGSKLGKEYPKAVYCHPAYLIYMQNKLWEMPGWMKHKLGSRLLGEISVTSQSRWYPSNGRKWRGTKAPLNEGEEAEWKSWLKTRH